MAVLEDRRVHQRARDNYDLSDSSNWIVLEKAAVTAALTATFSLKASYTLLYNNEPVPTFSKTDTATAVALVAKF